MKNMLNTHNKDSYRQQSEEINPTIVWLPSDNFSYRKHLKNIKTILDKTIHGTMTVIVTKILNNELEMSLPDKDILDEWNPLWWKQPPPELRSIQPATPHTRITRRNTTTPEG